MTHSEAITYLATLPPDDREAAEERIAIRVADGMPEAKAVITTAEERKCKK
jgi:hypothetical protein